jgi:alkylation response protein AidB-like acyl-CoA dehydrogenase
MKDLDEFRVGARAWLEGNLPARGVINAITKDEGELAAVALARELQEKLATGGYAGLLYPGEYGGQGLTREHQTVFDEESAGYEIPQLLAVTLGIIGPTLLDFGTDEQKRRHLPPMIRGEELWVQFMSEPSGGSDLASALTRATRDGDRWILNGSKVWSTGAHFSDYALCLARTNWEVPKHRGLTFFIVPIRSAGVTVVPIRQINGATDFCQEFFDDVELSPDSVVGAVDDGWTVASRLLVHERNAVGGASLDGGLFGSNQRSRPVDPLASARAVGRGDDPLTRQLAAESYVLNAVEHDLRTRVIAGLAADALPPAAGSILKLYGGTKLVRQAEIALEIGGSAAIASDGGSAVITRIAHDFLTARGATIGGGTNEIQRNIISERILQLPREPQVDRDVPFSEVRTNRDARS